MVVAFAAGGGAEAVARRKELSGEAQKKQKARPKQPFERPNAKQPAGPLGVWRSGGPRALSVALLIKRTHLEGPKN